jgi:hypothetical protein
MVTKLDIAIKAIKQSITSQENILAKHIADGKYISAGTTQAYISGLSVALEIVKGAK